MMKILVVLVILGVVVMFAWPKVAERVQEQEVAGNKILEPTGPKINAPQSRIRESSVEAELVINKWDEEMGRGQASLVMDKENEIEASVDRDEINVNEDVLGTKPGMGLAGTEAVIQKQEIFLPVPFIAQAPKGVWDQPYQDACEEAAVIMVERFLQGKGLTTEEMDSEILKMVDWQMARYALYEDTNSQETARLANDYFGLSSRVVYNVTAEDIRDNLRRGQPVIVLVDGRRLGNPFYTPPGPDKHALVITGFAEDEFITNDPGTRRGQSYHYATATLMGAMVDYDGREMGTGSKAMIVFD